MAAFPSPWFKETAVPLRIALAREFALTQPEPSDKPCLIVLSGLPGPENLISPRSWETAASVGIESDRLRKVLAPNPKYTRGESARLFAACHLLIEEYLLQDRLVLLDATNLTEGFRQPVYEIAERVSVPVVLARLTAPSEIVRRRLSDRGPECIPATIQTPDGVSTAGCIPTKKRSPGPT